jgi:hypothetical protein
MEQAGNPPLATTCSWETVDERRRVDTGGGGSTLAAAEHDSGVPWTWPHNAFVNLRANCYLLRGGTQSRVCKEDVASEDRLKGEGESRCDGEPVGDSRRDRELVGDSRRDGEPDHFIASAG